MPIPRQRQFDEWELVARHFDLCPNPCTVADCICDWMQAVLDRSEALRAAGLPYSSGDLGWDVLGPLAQANLEDAIENARESIA